MDIFQLLPASQYSHVRPLFDPLAHQLFCRAVLHHTMEGTVFVDDLATPRAAILVTRGMWAYFAGDPTLEDCSALSRAIASGGLTGPEAWGLYFSISGEQWIECFPAIFPAREPVHIPRLRYTASSPVVIALPPLPVGFQLVKIEPALADRVEISLPEDVGNLIRSWKGQQPDLQDGFGYVILHGETVAAHAVIDCIVDEQGDIGLVTHNDYLRRGFASIVSAAAINDGLKGGLLTIVWDCAANNTGSRRTAEKLGLQLERRHTMYLYDFEEMYHYIALSADLRDRGEYARSLECCQRVFELEDRPPAVTYFLQACALAGIQDQTGALQALKKAVTRGWNNFSAARERPEFLFLRGNPEWNALVASPQDDQ